MEAKPAGDVRFRPLAKVRLLVLLSFFAGLSQTLLAAVPGVEGRWGPLIKFTTVPISAAVLPNGKLLIFSSWDRFDFTTGKGARDKTYSDLYDPATGKVTESLVRQTKHDMFCPGTALMEDGRLVVNGGGPHVTTTSIYDFSRNQWVRGASMSRRRWYNGSTTLPGGGVFTLGGIPDDGVGELWTAGAGWSVLAGAPVTPMTVDAGTNMPRSEQHPKVLVAPSGKLFAAGPTPNMQWYDTAGGGSVQFAGRRGDDIYAQNNVTVMFDVGKILTAGGSPQYDAAAGAHPPASANAYVIDINSAVSTRKIKPMRHGRSYANGVILPDGRVLVVGGNGTGKAFTDTDAVFVPEMFDPGKEEWTPMARQATPRTYHSTALLLPDGRVFSGGGGLCGNCGVNHADGEIYSPPYLFKGPRPVIRGAPTVVGYNAPFSIATTGDVARLTFVRLSSTTHTVNTDQRFLPLKSVRKGGGSFTVTSPLNANIAPPGYYMLFALSATGVPSVSKIMKISGKGAPVGGGFRYVKLEEVSEVSGRPWGSAAELNVLDTNGNTIGRKGWVASADSAETTSSPAYPAANAIDGNPATLWHTRFVGASPPPPHWLVVDMGTSHPVGGFRYLPRQDGSSNGRIARYKFYVSANGVSWGRPLAQGTFAKDKSEKTVTFSAAPSNKRSAVTNPGNQTGVVGVGANINLAIGASHPNGTP